MIEHWLGVPINHLVEVNFENFPQLIDAMGGVNYTGGCIVSRLDGGFSRGGFGGGHIAARSFGGRSFAGRSSFSRITPIRGGHPGLPGRWAYQWQGTGVVTAMSFQRIIKVQAMIPVPP